MRADPGARIALAPRRKGTELQPLGLGSLDLQAQQVLLQLALLAGLGILELSDLLAEVVELGLLLVELLDIAVVEIRVLGELAHVLADAGLLLADLVDPLLATAPLGGCLRHAVAQLDDLAESFLDLLADRRARR